MAQCEVCGTDMTQGRGRARRTCSAACRQAAHRRRQAEQLATLRTATRPAPTLAPPVAEPVVLPVADDSPAGQIRAAGAQLLAAVEAAAWRAAQDWDTDTSGALPGHRRTMPADAVAAVRSLAEQTVAAILTSAPETSRNEPAPAAPVATAPAPAAPPARPKPTGPAAPEPSRNEPQTVPARKRMSRKAALAVADSAQLVKDADHRDNHVWHVVAEDGTVLGHVEPSYGGTSRSGRNGWAYRTAESSVSKGPHPTRDAAGIQCSLAWVRGVTTPARRD
jgi:hypothetical protein